mgnify:CR=1 FL=1
MGLAGMFVEPLEATSIGTTIEQGFGFLTSIPYWSRKDTIQQNQYNNVRTNNDNRATINNIFNDSNHSESRMNQTLFYLRHNKFRYILLRYSCS